MVMQATSSGKTRPIPIRLDKELRERLKRAAKMMGSNSSAIMRFSIMQQLTHIESGTISLTPAAPFKGSIQK